MLCVAAICLPRRSASYDLFLYYVLIIILFAILTRGCGKFGGEFAVEIVMVIEANPLRNALNRKVGIFK